MGMVRRVDADTRNVIPDPATVVVSKIVPTVVISFEFGNNDLILAVVTSMGVVLVSVFVVFIFGVDVLVALPFCVSKSAVGGGSTRCMISLSRYVFGVLADTYG